MGIPTSISRLPPRRRSRRAPAAGSRAGSAGAAYAKALEQVVLDAGPETVAAVVAEPVQGAGGVIIPPDDYFPLVRETDR